MVADVAVIPLDLMVNHVTVAIHQVDVLVGEQNVPDGLVCSKNVVTVQTENVFVLVIRIEKGNVLLMVPATMLNHRPRPLMC